MNTPISFSDKVVGDFFSVGEQCSVRVESIGQDREGERVERDHLLHYTFVVGVTLHCYEEGRPTIERSKKLTFRFRNAKNEALTFEDTRGTHRLSVDFITLEEDEELSAGFLLETVEGPLHTDSLYALGVKGRKAEKKEQPGKKRVLIIGVMHDDAEEELQRIIPTVLSHVEMSLPGRIPSLAVLWESPQSRNPPSLIPKEDFLLSRFTLPLEGDLFGILEFMWSAYTLCMLGHGKEEMKERVMGFHGYTRDDIKRDQKVYGEGGLVIDIVIHIIYQLLRLMMSKGRRKSETIMMTILHSEEAVTRLFTTLAYIYENIMLSKHKREQLRETRREYFQGREDDDEWYTTRFFRNFLFLHGDDGIFNLRQIRRSAGEFRNFLMGLVRQVIRGGDNSADMTRLSDPETGNYIAVELSRGSMEPALSELNGRKKMNEEYFSTIADSVQQLYGNVGSALLLQLESSVHDMEKSLGKAGVREYRDAQSFINVSNVFRETGVSNAALVVGTGHVDFLGNLFRSSGEYEVTTYHPESFEVGSAVVVHEKRWAASLTNYLTLEALDKWLFRDVTWVREPRLQLYLFLNIANRLNVVHYDLVAREGLESVMRLWYNIFMTVSPYREPLVYPTGERTASSTRAYFQKQNYPQALVEILVQYRNLSHIPTQRAAGELTLEEAFLASIAKQRHTLDVENLRTDWVSQMEQAEGNVTSSH